MSSEIAGSHQHETRQHDGVMRAGRHIPLLPSLQMQVAGFARTASMAMQHSTVSISRLAAQRATSLWSHCTPYRDALHTLRFSSSLCRCMLCCMELHIAASYCMKSSLHCFIVFSGPVEWWPIVRSDA